MNEWKTWSKQFERDMRDATESVRSAIEAGDPQVLTEGAVEFAQMIVECAVTPVAAMLGGLPRSLDVASWKGALRWADRRAWDDAGNRVRGPWCGS